MFNNVYTTEAYAVFILNSPLKFILFLYKIKCNKLNSELNR